MRRRRPDLEEISLFGADYSVDPRTGALVRPKAPSAPDMNPVSAASDALIQIQRLGRQTSEKGKWPHDLTGSSVFFRVSGSSQTTDTISRDVALAHGVSVFRSMEPSSGAVSYVFTTSPMAAMGLGKIGGLSISRI